MVTTEDSRDVILSYQLAAGEPLAIEFVGNESFSRSELLGFLGLERRVLPLTRSAAPMLLRKLKSRYLREGFLDVSLQTDVVSTGSKSLASAPNGAAEPATVIQVSIDEGKRRYVSDFSFEGNDSISSGELREVLQLNRRAIWPLSYIREGFAGPEQFAGGLPDVSKQDTLKRVFLTQQ